MEGRHHSKPLQIQNTSPHSAFPLEVKIPIFDGEDPIEWIAKAESIFEFYQTPEHHKVPCAMVCMEGPALRWMYWRRSAEPDMDWATFRRALMDRYDDWYHGSITNQLRHLKQTSTVDEYIDEFVRLAPHSTSPVSEKEYMEFFVSGLKPEIQGDVRDDMPYRLVDVMALALEVEAANITFK